MDYENNTNVAPATSSLILEERHDSELFRVYALILDGITDHLLLPGKKLTESELCRQMVARAIPCVVHYRFWRTIKSSICSPTAAHLSMCRT